ncbi:ribosomal protein S18 acetylase RimI-like enzyme [Murinocardiopsis flavida]|uniref:Ribosomal protein S18 acetylase RimI-like enzyme n=1 Tax=Murinocardiopsis flavida TaxID=645275 RepID=A0A2P8DJQ6_9ACTN|nr:GNAT family N-acetyltransferase [Murinocardiopsis flavida]PSK97434.1 ribosomal protein S18 acetylase RimI-like enzyme [Murinocardiopsis flavida]
MSRPSAALSATGTRVRPAERGDVPEIRRLIGELAEYEKAAESATASEADLAEALFGPQPAAYALIAEAEAPGGGSAVAGFTVYFRNFSTWTGRHGIYMEDLYVRPEFRGSGLGRAMMAELAAICAERGYTRLEWSVLDWNTPAIDFYLALGAVAMDEWTVHRLSGDALAAFAGSRSQEPGAAPGSGA